MTISKDNTRIQITIPKKVKSLLKLKAKQDNRSVSNYVEQLILKDLNLINDSSHE